MRARDWIPLLTVSCLLLTSAPAGAQEKGHTGLTVAFPAAIGVIWHVSDSVALRPDVSFSWSTSSVNPSTTPVPPTVFTSGGDGSSYGVGLSGLFYVRRWENLSAYVSPRFSYARTSTTVTTTISGVVFTGLDGSILNGTVDGSSFSTEGTSSSYGLSGAFGAQYSLGRKFGVFGEAGFGYSHSSSSTTSSLPSSSSSGLTVNAFGTRAGVGVIVYF